MSRLEHAMRSGAPLNSINEPMHDEDERLGTAESGPPTAEDMDSASPHDMVPGEVALISSLEAKTVARGIDKENEVEPGPVVQLGQPSIPANHTPLAAFLLRWCPISFLVNDILEAENVKYVGEFPIRQEERRGLLRIWGRGEGPDSSSPVDRVDRETVYDVSDTGVPSPADCWGGIAPDFIEPILWKYVKSYHDNIQNMHPLIIPVEFLHGSNSHPKPSTLDIYRSCLRPQNPAQLPP